MRGAVDWNTLRMFHDAFCALLRRIVRPCSMRPINPFDPSAMGYPCARVPIRQTTILRRLRVAAQFEHRECVCPTHSVEAPSREKLDDGGLWGPNALVARIASS